MRQESNVIPSALLISLESSGQTEVEDEREFLILKKRILKVKNSYVLNLRSAHAAGVEPYCGATGFSFSSRVPLCV